MLDLCYINTAGPSAYGIKHDAVGSGLNYCLRGWIPFFLPRGTRRVPVDPDAHVLHTLFF